MILLHYLFRVDFVVGFCIVLVILVAMIKLDEGRCIQPHYLCQIEAAGAAIKWGSRSLL